MQILDSLIDQNNLKVHYDYRMPSKQGGLICDKDVYINPRLSDREQNQWLAEEIGHYETTVGNIIDTKNLNNKKQEKQARDYGCKLLINLDGLIACWRQDIEKSEDVADIFNVTVPYLWGAIDMYRRKRGINFLYKGYRFDLSNGIQIKKENVYE